jgi:hypothetical protein
MPNSQLFSDDLPEKKSFDFQAAKKDSSTTYSATSESFTLTKANQ